MNYQDYIANKMSHVERVGIDHGPLSDILFDYQKALTSRALRRGRFCLFTDTGTGKTMMQLEFARHVPGRVLVLAPLAVAEQTVDEGAKLDMSPKYLRKDDGKTRVVVTNYEMLDKFNPSHFEGVVLDESSILKAQDGKTRTFIINAFRNTPYRLACTATPSPNDHMELGNHAEFLGEKSYQEMLAEYFVHDGGSTQHWRLKGHAKDMFWQWVCSWAAFMRHPSDLGFVGSGYELPPLNMIEHIIPVDHVAAQDTGTLFAMQAHTLNEQRKVRRDTMSQRIEKAIEIVMDGANGTVKPCVIWCELNPEQDALASKLSDVSVSIYGTLDYREKRDRLLSWLRGEKPVLITKPKIAGHGINMQRASRMVFVGASHSFEQTYQAIRRCWRFGQRNPVDVNIIRAETEEEVIDNYRRKERQFADMHKAMILHTKNAMEGARWTEYNPTMEMEVPSWLR